MVHGRVDRYEAANVRALNFVMHGALGGGGPRSLRADSLGKTLGGALVRLEIDVPASLAAPPPAATRTSPGPTRSSIICIEFVGFRPAATAHTLPAHMILTSPCA